MNAPRVLFVLKYRESPYSGEYSYSGQLSSGLWNSAQFVSDMLTASGTPSSVVHVVDNNSIYTEILKFKPNIVIIEAYWVIPAKFAELKTVCPNVLFVVRSHSEYPFLANEGMALGWTMQYVNYPNVIMAGNSTQFVEETKFLVSRANPTWTENTVDAKIIYLPNYYPTDLILPNKPPNSGGTLDVGCFGAIRPLKNQLLQAIAALKYADSVGKKLRFHINGSRLEMVGTPILKNLIQLFGYFPDDELVLHSWMLHPDFLNLVVTMDLVMQVSFSETYNIVAADAVVSGVPIVTSEEVTWVSNLFKAKTTDSDDIVSKMIRAVEFPQWFPYLRPNLDGLQRSNQLSQNYWSSFIAGA